LPIRWRLTLFNALIIGAILLALGLSLFLLLREALLSGVEDTVRSRAFAAARALESGENPLKDEEDVRELTADGVFLAMRDARGRVLNQQPSNVSTNEEIGGDVWKRALASGNPVGGMAELRPLTRSRDLSLVIGLAWHWGNDGPAGAHHRPGLGRSRT
jgi:two-component system, OmpR family, sensor kinase